MGVVAAVTAKCQQAQAQGDTTARTPQQWANMCGYHGSKASQLRVHIGRQHNQGAQRTGNGRYPAMPAGTMLRLMGLGHLVRQADTTAQQRKAASGQVGRTLWPKRKAAAKGGARKAKATAQQQAAAKAKA